MHAGLQGAAIQRWPKIAPSAIIELQQVLYCQEKLLVLPASYISNWS